MCYYACMSTTKEWTVRDLRRRWKPHKERLLAQRQDHPTVIRVHRCCSWMQRIEQQNLPPADEAALIFRWIALNALYGQWNEERKEPIGDRSRLANFVDEIIALDESKHVIRCLEQHKKLVLKIMEDEYLAVTYWEQLTDEAALRAKKTKEMQRYYREEKLFSMFMRPLERIYLMRCQLVHGAATAGGKLNRTSLRRCNMMLDHLLPAVLLVIIDHGADADWGGLCYPPVDHAANR